MKKTGILTTCLLFLTAAIWGFAFVAQVAGVEHVGSLTLNGVRFAVGALSLLPVALIVERGRRPREEQKKTVFASLIAGVVLCIATNCQQIGIEITRSAGEAGFITGLYMVLVPIGGLLIFRRKTAFTIWIGAFLGVVGLFLLCFEPGEGLQFGIGELFLLLGSIAFTAHILVVDYFAASLRPLHFSVGQFSVCSVICLVLMLLFEEPTLSGLWGAKWAILYCGVLSVGVAYTLQVVAQKRADPTFATIVLSTESVFSAVGGAIFGIDSSISVLGYVGCGLIFCGILVSQLPVKTKKDTSRNKEKENTEP